MPMAGEKKLPYTHVLVVDKISCQQATVRGRRAPTLPWCVGVLLQLWIHSVVCTNVGLMYSFVGDDVDQGRSRRGKRPLRRR
jgi:hypothetical protein